VSSEPVTEPLFAAPFAKVGRARTFIAELADEQERYANIGVTARVLVENGFPQLHVNWEGTGLLPGIILGDAIHNLRSALDLMATELAVIAKQNPEEAYFPFSTDPESLRKSKKFKAFAKSGADCAILLETIAPYRGGNEALRALHDLDVQDKHRSLIPSLKDIEFEFEGEFELDDPTNHSVTAKAEVTLYKFPDDSPLAGQPIIPTLEMLAEEVQRVLEAFAALVAARE
jgi:hypothetical protein